MCMFDGSGRATMIVDVGVGEGRLGEIIVMNNKLNNLHLTRSLYGTGLRIILVSGGGFRRFPPLVCRVTSTNVSPDSVSFPFHRVFHGHGGFCFHVTRTETMFPSGGVLRASVNGVRCSCLIFTTKAAAGFCNGTGVRG